MIVRTVGALREALDEAPDDRPLHCQVIATDGTVGYMVLSASPTVCGGNTSMACISMSHINLETLAFKESE